MTAATWVLIIAIEVARGGGPATISGYESRAACEAAGQAWRQEAKNQYGIRAFCIPGPSR